MKKEENEIKKTEGPTQETHSQDIGEERSQD